MAGVGFLFMLSNCQKTRKSSFTPREKIRDMVWALEVRQKDGLGKKEISVELVPWTLPIDGLSFYTAHNKSKKDSPGYRCFHMKDQLWCDQETDTSTLQRIIDHFGVQGLKHLNARQWSSLISFSCGFESVYPDQDFLLPENTPESVQDKLAVPSSKILPDGSIFVEFYYMRSVMQIGPTAVVRASFTINSNGKVHHTETVP